METEGHISKFRVYPGCSPLTQTTWWLEILYIIIQKQTNLTWWKNDCHKVHVYIQISWTDYIALPQITDNVFWSIPNGMVQTIWFSNHNFWFSHVIGTCMYKFPCAHILPSWNMESPCLLSSQHKSSLHLHWLLLLTFQISLNQLNLRAINC